MLATIMQHLLNLHIVFNEEFMLFYRVKKFLFSIIFLQTLPRNFFFSGINSRNYKKPSECFQYFSTAITLGLQGKKVTFLKKVLTSVQTWGRVLLVEGAGGVNVNLLLVDEGSVSTISLAFKQPL